MLSVIFGEAGLQIENRIENTSGYFDAEFEPSWFESEEARAIIKDIDDSVYVSGSYIESPVFGGMSPERLSTGCKTLLLLLNEPDLIVSGERMGDNCYPWLLKLAESRDITITLYHLVDLEEPFKIHSVNSNRMISTNLEIIEELYADNKWEVF